MLHFTYGPILHLYDKMKEINCITEKSKLIDSYTLITDKVPVSVNIWDCPNESIPIYHIKFPNIGLGTQAFLNSLKEEITRGIPLRNELMTDPKIAKKIKLDYYKKLKSSIAEKLPDISKEKLELFSGITLHKMHGLGDLEIILGDNLLEEVTINGSKEPISIYHKKHGWCKTILYPENEEEIYNISALIGRNIGKDITNLNPIMDAHLLTGDRVASTLFPISTSGNTITIRRFARTPWTITHFISPEYNTMTSEMAAILWQAMQYELNIIVAGGTASGKTSVLNTLSSFIPPTQRIISVEDTREISLPKPLHWNWVPMSSRTSNIEGQGEISMLDLIIASLRMRPDRMIVGEIRKQEQAQALFEAMHTGHSIYSTMHADTAQQVKRRLTEPPMNIPLVEVSSLHLILVQYRDRRKGIRRTMELTEVMPATGETSKLELNTLYRWLPRKDQFEKVNSPIRIIDELNLHTGMTVKEINDDLNQKVSILNWLKKEKVYNIDDLGNILKTYYKEPDKLIKAVNNKWKIEKVI